jgi:hypothetical protein
MIIFEVPSINKDNYLQSYFLCVCFQAYFPHTVYTLSFALGCLFFFGCLGFSIFAVFTCPPVPVLGFLKLSCCLRYLLNFTLGKRMKD